MTEYRKDFTQIIQPSLPLKKRVFRWFCWFVIICAALTAWDAYLFLTKPASYQPEEVNFTVRTGAPFSKIARDLKEAGLINDDFRFRILAQVKGQKGSIRAGEYRLSTGSTPSEILDILIKGQPALYRLFVREGLFWWETARAVEDQGFATYEDFKEVIHDPEFLKEHNIPFDNAEGFLFPETYMLGKPKSPLDKEQARTVASLMVRTFWRKTAPAWNQLPLKKGVTITAADRASSPYAPSVELPSQGTNEPVEESPTAGNEVRGNATLAVSNSTSSLSGEDVSDPENPLAADRADSEDQSAAAAPSVATPKWKDEGPQKPSDVDPAALRRLVIMASLVEKETGVPLERPKVAGVYANRLRVGMLLQCDPTIIYGVGPSFKGSILRSQLNDEKNPYNTYIHPGLPPGPICSPGAAAMAAAARPEKHDYLYFVATGLPDGSHTFSKSLKDHNKAVQVYRSRTRGR